MDAAPSLRLRIFWPFPILLSLGLCSLQNFGINKFIFVPNHPVSTIPVTEVEMGSKMTQTPSCACQLQICSMSVFKAAQCPCASPSSSMVSVQSPWESLAMSEVTMTFLSSHCSKDWHVESPNTLASSKLSVKPKTYLENGHKLSPKAFLTQLYSLRLTVNTSVFTAMHPDLRSQVHNRYDI